MMHGFGLGGFGGIGSFGLLAGLLNLIITAAFFVGIVLLAIWAVRRFAANSSPGQAPSPPAQAEQSPRDILMQRYARGEIDREQYQQMLADLG